MNYSAKYLAGLLKKKGFILKRSKGSHHLYFSPKSKKTVTVPTHGNKDLPKGTFFAILKQAGIDKKDL